jgi:hypothetical protein
MTKYILLLSLIFSPCVYSQGNQMATHQYVGMSISNHNVSANAHHDIRSLIGQSVSTNDVVYTNTINKAGLAYGWGDHSLAGYVLNSWFTNWASTNIFGQMVTVSGGLTATTNNGVVTIDGSGKWQNPASATDWTWTSDGKEITLTSYSSMASTSVIIPSILDGLPVRKIASYAFQFRGSPMNITSISGAENITELGANACDLLANLISVSMPSLKTIGANAFNQCTSLVSVSIPKVETIGDVAFGYCTSLNSVKFSENAPSIGSDIYYGITESQVTNYVTNPTATGWGSTFGGMPVVRMPIESERVNAGTVISITSTATGTNTAGYFVGNGGGITNVNATLLGGYSSSEYFLTSWFTNWVSTNVFGVMVSASGGLTATTNNGVVTVDGSGKLDTNLLVTSGAVTNQIIVSPLGTNNVATVWKGTYAEYVALTDKTNTTTYIITDDLQYDTKGIYSEVYDYESVYPTTTVTVAQEKAVYTVLMTTNTVINFDMSTLNFQDKIADFELHLAMTNVSYSIGFTSGGIGLTSNTMYWVSGYPPDLSGTNKTYYIGIRAFETNSLHSTIKYSK